MLRKTKIANPTSMLWSGGGGSSSRLTSKRGSSSSTNDRRRYTTLIVQCVVATIGASSIMGLLIGCYFVLSTSSRSSANVSSSSTTTTTDAVKNAKKNGIGPDEESSTQQRQAQQEQEQGAPGKKINRLGAGGGSGSSKATMKKRMMLVPPPAVKPADIPNFEASPGIASLREEFYRRYGGEKVAKTILGRGVRAYGSMDYTALRMLRAAAANRPFTLAFAGYSVTVGRGNFFKQSFPFCLERILKPVLASSTLQLDMKVRNAAIGGIPSFPYGFCLEHFLGNDNPDVVSWDYSMNEGNGAAVLEAYLRHSQHQFAASRPMMIVLDTHKGRCGLLQQYSSEKYNAGGGSNIGIVPDSLCLGMAKDAIPNYKNAVEQLPDDNPKKPPGLTHWDEFGAPAKCPGRGSWHPRKMEHELLGWMLAMHFAEALERAERLIAANPDSNWKQTYLVDDETNALVETVKFPPPLQTPPVNDPAVTGLLYGHPTSEEQSSLLVMKDVSCRTNFLPAVDQDKVLPSVIVSGLAPGPTAETIMEERTDADYDAGWVLDVSSVERGTKVKVEKCGGLGYVDMKIALYGVANSGTLRLWLPMEGRHNKDGDHHVDHDYSAKHWFHGLVICEANEKRGKEACKLDEDLEYAVGNVRVPASATKMIKGAAEYLKRKTCVSIAIPEAATVTKLSDVTKAADNGGNTAPLEEKDRIRLLGGKNGENNNNNEDQIGLVVDLKAKQHVTRNKGACCLSHVVWEQH